MRFLTVVLGLAVWILALSDRAYTKTKNLEIKPSKSVGGMNCSGGTGCYKIR